MSRYRLQPTPAQEKALLEHCGRWHVVFAAIPEPTAGPGTGKVVGVDRGITVSAALSTGELLAVPGLNDRERKRLLLLQRRLARARKGSNRRARVKLTIAKRRVAGLQHRAHGPIGHQHPAGQRRPQGASPIWFHSIRPRPAHRDKSTDPRRGTINGNTGAAGWGG